MLRWLHVVFFAGLVTINALANYLPIAGVKTEDVSQKYQHLFAPADYAFAIWGVIYALLAGFVWYQALKKNAHIAGRCGGWFLVNCAANALWMVLWHYQWLGLSTVCMGVIVLSLVELNKRLGDARNTWQEKLFIRGGFGLYLGWICVAAAANAAAFLVQMRFDGWGIAPQVWTMALSVLLALLSLSVLQEFENLFFGAAVVWGLIGVGVQHITTFDLRYPFALSAIALSALIVLIRMGRMIFWKKSLHALE